MRLMQGRAIGSAGPLTGRCGGWKKVLILLEPYETAHPLGHSRQLAENFPEPGRRLLPIKVTITSCAEKVLSLAVPCGTGMEACNRPPYRAGRWDATDG